MFVTSADDRSMGKSVADRSFRKSVDGRLFVKSAFGRPLKNSGIDKLLGKSGAGRTPDNYFPQNRNILLRVALLYPIVIFFVSGFLCSHVYFMSKDKQVLNLLLKNEKLLENLEINVRGRVSGHVKNKNGTSYFSITLDKLMLKDLNSGNSQTLNAKDEVFAKIRTNDSYFLKRDDFISFNCRVSNNKGYISLAAYEENVVKTESQSTDRLSNYYTDKTNSDTTADRTEKTGSTLGVSDITREIYNIRSKFYECIKNTLYGNLDYRTAGLCEAIILGNTNNISEKTITDFRKSGIYHLIAISGLHINFFIYLSIVFISFILSPLNTGKKNSGVFRLVSFIAIIVVLFLYNFIAGEKASALRATFMSVFVLSANLLERQYSKKIILSLTFIILLALYPEFFYDWGFWLSFTSMAGILYLYPVLTDLFRLIMHKIQKSGSYFFGSFSAAGDPDNSGKRYMGRSRGADYFISSVIITVSVNIFIFPVIIYLFKELPVFSIPANLLAGPVFYALLAVLLIASFAALLWPPVGGFILKPAWLLVEILLKIARIYKLSDYNVITLSNLKPVYMVIYYLVLAAVFIALSQWINKRKSRGR